MMFNSHNSKKKRTNKPLNPGKESPSLWRRFGLIFHSDFIEKVILKETDSRKTWGFWFLSNTFISLVITISVAIFLHSFLPGFLNKEIIRQIPEGAEVRIEDGLLITENIPDPILFTPEESEKEFVFVLDTKADTYQPQILNNYNTGFFINQHKVIVKDGSESQKEISFKELEQEIQNGEKVTPLILNKETIQEWMPKILKAVSTVGSVVIFFIAWFSLCILRLISALFWALLFWVVGGLAEIKGWGFEKSFNSILHFKLVTILLFPAAALAGLGSFWAAFIILGLLFGMNFWHIKKA